LIKDFFETKQEFIGRIILDKGIFDDIKQHISRSKTDIHILVQTKLRRIAQKFDLVEIFSIEWRLRI